MKGKNHFYLTQMNSRARWPWKWLGRRELTPPVHEVLGLIPAVGDKILVMLCNPKESISKRQWEWVLGKHHLIKTVSKELIGGENLF